MQNIALSEIRIDAEMKAAVSNVLTSGIFVKGEQNRKFEKEFAEFCNTKYAVTVSSGTAAIFLSLYALGLSRLKRRDGNFGRILQGTEIIVPSYTFIATVTPIIQLGGTPVFADIEPRTYNLSPEDVKKKITKKTIGLIPVHLYGHPAPMDELKELAEEHDLFLLEDACQSHGALYKNKKVGSLGHAAAFSFYPSKVMTVAGDGGMITTNDEEFANLVVMLRDHGRTEKYLHQFVGFNFRLSEVHAAIGRVQLKKVTGWIEKRRENAKKYNERLEKIAGIISVPIEQPWARHVYYVYTIMCMKRDMLAEYLKKNGIATGIYYPVPCHQQPCIAKLIKPKKLHYTEECAKNILSLPMHPYLSDADLNYVCDKIFASQKFYKNYSPT